MDAMAMAKEYRKGLLVLVMAEAEAEKIPTSNVLVLSKRVENFIWKQYDFAKPMTFVQSNFKTRHA